jgi:hypothetical protein
MTPSIVAPHAASRSRTIPVSIALMPMWLLVVTALASSAFQVVLTDPPTVLSMPLGVVLEAVAMLWTLLGAVVVWRARSPLTEAIALLVFTIPATVAVVATPALIELLPTLG